MSTEPLYVASAGDPTLPLLVLIHGAMDRSAGMLRLSRQLDKEHHVVRYDRRGYGKSTGADGPHTIEQHIDDLERIVATDGRPALLFGHSLGGNIALALAERRPALVRAVAVYETPLTWIDWWPGNTASGAAALQSDPADSAEAFMRRLVGDDVWERLPPSTRTARRDEGVSMVAELADLRRGAPWNGLSIDVPVLAAHGEHGSPHHHRGTRHLAELVPGSTLVELAGAGHGAPNTHAAELAGLLRSAWHDVDAP